MEWVVLFVVLCAIAAAVFGSGGVVVSIDYLSHAQGFTSPHVGWLVLGALFGSAWALVLLGRYYRADSLTLAGAVGLFAITVAGTAGYGAATSSLSRFPHQPLPAQRLSVQYITGDEVNVRRGPSTSAAVAYTLKRGQAVSLMTTDGDWGQVALSDRGGNPLGWIHRRYLSSTQPTLSVDSKGHSTADLPLPAVRSDSGRDQEMGALRAGGEVTTPRLLHNVKPLYTAEALRAKIHGTVVIDCVVLPDGTVGKTRIARSLDSGLDEEAVKAIQQSRWAPGTKQGVAVPVLVSVEFTFNLR